MKQSLLFALLLSSFAANSQAKDTFVIIYNWESLPIVLTVPLPPLRDSSLPSLIISNQTDSGLIVNICCEVFSADIMMMPKKKTEPMLVLGIAKKGGYTIRDFAGHRPVEHLLDREAGYYRTGVWIMEFYIDQKTKRTAERMRPWTIRDGKLRYAKWDTK